MQSLSLFLLRFVFGAIILYQYGILWYINQKFFSHTFHHALGMSGETLYQIMMYLNIIGASFLLFGLFTRIAASMLSVSTLIFIIILQNEAAWKIKEFPIAALTVFIALIFLGPGNLAIDYLVKRKYRIKY